MAPSLVTIADATGSATAFVATVRGKRNRGGVLGFAGIFDQRTGRSREHLSFF
jgi:hypothetical protein